MPELPIRAQGFPTLITDLGVVQPLAGPFWTILTTVSPVYVVGGSDPVPQAPTPYPLENFVDAIVANPLGGAVIAQTPLLSRGKYSLWLGWDFNNGAAEFSRILFQVHDAGGGTTQLQRLDLIGMSTSTRPLGSNNIEIGIENPHDQGFFDIQVTNALTACNVRGTIRWRKMGQILNFTS